MVHVEPSMLPEGQADLIDYLSEDSDENEQDLGNRDDCLDLESKPTLDCSFKKTLLVAGIPIILADRYEKLQALLRKVILNELKKKELTFTSVSADECYDKDRKEFQMTIPCDESGGTVGLCILSFKTEQQAILAQKILNGFALDRAHTFRCIQFDDFESVISRNESYQPFIKLLGFTRETFRLWLLDERVREQFVLRYEDRTEIYWHDPVEREPRLIHDGSMTGKRVWTDFRVQWSPHGSYLATFHKPGIALWAGQNFEKKVRFEHKDVKQMEFSPNENYVLTWDGRPAALNDERSVRIWQTITGECLQTFTTPELSPYNNEFPHFLWSHDDRFVAHIGNKVLCVYELPSMKLIPNEKNDETPLKYHIQKFAWSPADNYLSLWIAGSEDIPGRLLLIEIPSRKEIASRNVCNVSEMSMHWQAKGDLLCLRANILRKNKKKKGIVFAQLEIFRMREKKIPVDTIQIEDCRVRQFLWEGGASKRFALVVEDDATKTQAIHFYKVSDAGSHCNTFLVETYPVASNMNVMKWSPTGANFILASLSDGFLHFCSLTENDKVDLMHKDEHYMVNDIKWSSCGRFIATSVCIPMIASGATNNQFRYATDSGYRIWTFQGKLQHKAFVHQFYQFHWRPHPPSLLSHKKIEDIKKNLREYSRKYDAIDEKLRLTQRDAYIKKRQLEMDKFNSKLERLEEWKINHPLYEIWKAQAREYDEMFSWDVHEELYEEELDVKEQVVA